MQPDTDLQPPPSSSFSLEQEAAARNVGKEPAPEPPRSHWLRNLIIAIVVVALAAGGYFRIQATREAAAQKQGPGGRGGGPGGAPVPVIAGTVAMKDVPIYLEGLGTIQALNTVTVRARVDGQIEKIAFQEGQDVKEGDLLAQIDPAPFKAALDQAEAKLRQDEAQAANSKRDLVRNQELMKKEVIAAQALDYANTQTVQLEAQVRNDQAAVENARVQLAYATVTSPLNGRTGIRLVDQGNIVHASDATGIVVITQLQPITLLFTLPEQNLAQIHEQQTAQGNLRVLAIGRDNKTVVAEGKLTVIDNQIDTTTGSMRLKAEFPNADYTLWPGQFCNARLLVTTRKGGLVVPASVIQRGPDGSYAYVITGDTVEMRPVKVAQIEGGEALLDDGLAAGESVVVDGQYKLQPGSHIKVGEAPGRPGAGAANPGGHAGPGRHGTPAPAGRQGSVLPR